MKVKMFSVYDKKAAYYGTPFCFPRRELAERAFSDLVNDPKSSLFNHAEDFTLHYIGEFDDDLGLIVSVSPEPIVVGASVKRFRSAVVPPEVVDGVLS